MIRSVLTVCTGNICRSPLAAEALRRLLDGVDVSSAGLHAVVGAPVDQDSLVAARIFNIEPSGHIARQFRSEIGQSCDLILVMEARHRREIAERWPQFLGKTFLLGHFENSKKIMDPYRKGSMMHIHMAEQVRESARLWAESIRSGA